MEADRTPAGPVSSTPYPPRLFARASLAELKLKALEKCVLGWGGGEITPPIPRASLVSDAAFRWYPVRADVNDAYLEETPPTYIGIIDDRWGDLASWCGYQSPDKA